MIEIVDYYADWCPPCKIQGPIMDELDKELGGEAKVRKVNVDESQEAIKMGVKSIPTIIVFKDGEEVKRFIGVTQKEDLLNEVKKHE